jgi:NADPH:quinone reductase-like Zn-dependent oxidoreductase
MGIAAGGAQAERLAVDRRVLLPIPDGMGFVEAGAIPEAFLTAFDALFERGRLQPGESVLIRAAASGVGLAAAALAHEAGAVPIALTRTEQKRKRLEAMGYATALPAGRPVDVVIDFVGADAWAENLEVLAPLGRLVLVGTLSGSRVELDLGVLLRKRLTVVGTVLRTRTVEEKAALAASFARRMLPLFASSRLRPVVDRTFTLEEAAAAHAVLERNENFGKLVLTL